MNIINNNYKLVSKLGSGSFSNVCLSISLHNNKYYAVKLENNNTNLLKHEATVIQYLCGSKCQSVPLIFYYGLQGNYTCLVMTYYDEGNLKSNYKNMNFESKIQWWNQMMDAFKHIHSCGIVHRDLKPEHFMTKNNKWYILDFGLSNTFLDSNNTHINNCKKHDMIGTPKYTSINIHYGHEYSCRDDFISLIYIFVDIIHDSFINFHSIDKNINTNDISLIGNFNLWLREQKEWHIIKDLKFENKLTNNIFHSLFIQAENLNFYEKPCYTLLLS